MAVYDINGNNIGGGSSAGLDRRTILHQGYHPTGVDGNSKSAFIGAYNNGFTIVEADLAITSDNVMVMSHDSVSDKTLAQWQTSSEKLTFEQFLMLAKKLNLEVYLDGKSGMGTYLSTVYGLVLKNGMLDKFTFTGSLSGMHSVDQNARIAYLVGNLGDDLSGYDAGSVLYCNYTNVTNAEAQNAVEHGFTLEFYTFNTTNAILNCVANLPQGERWCTDNISADATLANNAWATT